MKTLLIVVAIILVLGIGLLSYLIIDSRNDQGNTQKNIKTNVELNTNINNNNESVVNNSGQNTNTLNNTNSVRNTNISNVNTSDEWLSYTNENDCYSVNYLNPDYHWEYGDLVNFDMSNFTSADAPPVGAVRIQFQKHLLNNGQSFEEMISEYNQTIEETGFPPGGGQATLIEESNLGRITHHNTFNGGGGNNFNQYYAETLDNLGYYLILVWYLENGSENVQSILSSFTPLTCED